MRRAWVVILLVACTPGPARVKEPLPHPKFPIAVGQKHEIGIDAGAEDGQMKCTSCHALTNATYEKFECTGCHEHAKEIVDARHAPYAAYSYDSATCYICHGASIRVGGFLVDQPPAADAKTTQAGIEDLAHPAIPATAKCTSCHSQVSGGRRAFAYDHAFAPAKGCAACHEAGSDLVGLPWILDAQDAVPIAATCASGGGMIADRAGDTRPIGIATLACSSNGAGLMCGSRDCSLNHFYPADCSECHRKPTVVPATVQSGATYRDNWSFQHFYAEPAQPATCCHCHSPPNCRG